MYARRLGNVLVPGVTARTERARYLGMVCAGLRQTSTPGQTVKERRRAFLPFERGWALAVTIAASGNIKHRPDGATRSRLKPAYEGFRGANRVLAHYRTVSEDKHVAPTAYKLLSAQEAQGGLGAYLVTLAEFNLVHRESLDLTPGGRDLAEAFEGSTEAPLRNLVASSRVRRSRLRSAGGDLTLTQMSAGERRLCGSLLFDGASAMAELVRRMRHALGERLPSSEAGLRAIADPRGDELAQAAHYAVCFDPFRRALGELFARLGSGLEGRPGAHRLADLADEDPRSRRRSLHRWPARRVRGAVGGFHGYTVGSAMRMLRDIEAAACRRSPGSGTHSGPTASPSERCSARTASTPASSRPRSSALLPQTLRLDREAGAKPEYQNAADAALLTKGLAVRCAHVAIKTGGAGTCPFTAAAADHAHIRHPGARACGHDHGSSAASRCR